MIFNNWKENQYQILKHFLALISLAKTKNLEADMMFFLMAYRLKKQQSVHFATFTFGFFAIQNARVSLIGVIEKKSTSLESKLI